MRGVKLNSAHSLHDWGIALGWELAEGVAHRKWCRIPSNFTGFILGGMIWEIGLGVGFRNWLAGLRWLRATVVCTFDLSLPRQDSIQAMEHFRPSFIIHLLSADDVVRRGRTRMKFTERLLVLNVVAIDVHRIDAFDLRGKG